MTWDEVIAAHVAQLNADTTIIATIGADRVFPALDTRAVHMDAIEWQFLDDFEEEVFNPLLCQWDIYTQSRIVTGGSEHAWTRAATVERAMRRLMHFDVYRVIGGIYMRSQIDSARTIPVQQPPDQPPRYHRQLDFVYEPLRSKYPVGPTS